MAMRLRPLALAIALIASLAANAQTAPAESAPASGTEASAPTEPALATMETVVVTGIQPGPGLWQIRKGENTLWVMATLSPLPKRMEWEPRELDALVARADRVLGSPGVGVDADIGFFGSLRLLPTALRARNNPDDKTLAEVLPPELYARWQAQKAIYMGRDRGVENRRPVFAAYELMDEALGDLDLKRENIVWNRVERIAKRNDRPIVGVSVRIKVEDPRDALKEFERSAVDDVGCMESTLARLETDTANMVERANAWAVGDLQTLEELEFDSEIRACALALLGTDALKNRGFDDLPKRVVDEWVRVAEESLAGHATTVAVADYQVLTADDGLLAAMRAKGYTIIAPGEEPPADAVTEGEPAGASAPVEATEPASN
ncbi:TraB/GumN family protein [Silanimonas sp.]|uniref:TraB/GumN family protein n=1 Tax=Silanimonas sp. TaxID=1929290 RepID=UPI0022C24EB5|nr:TraB/GumN family protein [Silanimonas sp.]MCZ8164183.1 TraB/GumN family protein [Silanimonas sp.]